MTVSLLPIGSFHILEAFKKFWFDGLTHRSPYDLIVSQLQAIFQLFSSYPPLGRALSSQLISMQDTVIATAIGNMFIFSEIEAKSFGDRSQDICKYKESNLGPVAGFQGCNYREERFFNVYVLRAHAVRDQNKLSVFALSGFVSCLVLFCSPLKSFFRPN